MLVSPFSRADKPDLNAVLQQLHSPPGFKISIYADNLPNARSLALGDNGVVYIGSRGIGDEGVVYAVQDKDGDGVAEQRYVLADKLYMPNGVAYKDGTLYVAEVNRIIRFDKIGEKLANPPQPVVVYDKFPGDKHHGWKYLRFGPDGLLYTAVGVNCNICEPEKPIFGSLLRLSVNGGEPEILARGIRNTVGFDWEPNSGRLFFNENGRDYLGEDLPPEELNLWTKPGEHFGYPYCHAGDIPDPQFAGSHKCSEFTPPVWKYKAHIAPLGLRFYTGSTFPQSYQQQLFVAQHGSWNRSKPQGYQIALIKFKDGKPVAEETFISGWLQSDDHVLGRPVDILQLPDGSLLISDDKLGVVYKVEYKK
jgi:glucose/arabinose dehydrogenase